MTEEPNDQPNPPGDLLPPRSALVGSEIFAADRIDLRRREEPSPANSTVGEDVVRFAFQVPIPHRWKQRRSLVGARQLPLDIVQGGHHAVPASTCAEVVSARALRVDVQNSRLEILWDRPARDREGLATLSLIHGRAAWWKY